MTIFMISDLKQQKIGFQEKIAFIKRCLKKHIYNPIRTRLHFPITFNYFLYNVQLFEKFKLARDAAYVLGNIFLDHK